MTASSLFVDPRVVTGLRHGDTHALERLVRRCYSTLIDLAETELGPDSRKAGQVVEHAFLRVWEEHTAFQTPDVVEVFLESAVREGAVRERSELRLRRRFDATTPIAVVVEARLVEDAWTHVRELIAPT
jgi:hypothetical protein